ncbi:putative bifunctional diguanylate cyclase/phosphodiesterase [Desulfurivibrio alkaliphilus]|uniref:Response regulator receiver modulated diguanylate cyclase/phosphodiesterase with PAS/PAC sensor(S) n=1 Tax=Desulfurivibrio alkaliphilus (strain DSM 19089 / UNIQEM U267 / AHT2) TaxID=589865 RepID=D6Z440_DESAT|nr:EAL domain-containing protein [Desulfurivibrio alkaliphilus]ADH86315.1 response regulator receiver modulated diguanylate cyclase/phosphodiesterase with PAS/PAC sensor(s) [Desulfurivibrio alkaliphilus AHT 2]
MTTMQPASKELPPLDEQLYILVVDDRRLDRESLVELLRAYDYQVTGVADGDQAREHVNTHRTDLVLVDMVMPQKDGIEVLRELKLLHPELEVILITAYATLEKAVAGLREGAYDFLTKPCPTDTLIAAVERVREKKKLQWIIESAEERLRRSEYFFHAILESLGEAVVVIGRDMRIISANQGYRHQTGREDEEIIGRHCYEISHGYSRPCWLEEEGCVCAVIRCFQDGSHHTAIHTHRDKEGNPIYVETNAYPLRPGDGQMIYAAVETIRDITELKLMEEEKQRKEVEVYRLAFYDPLTGLPNRRLLLDRLGQAFAASERTGQHGALLFLDLDRFKNINDTRGHQAGDLILREAARRLRATVREDDTVSRQGGDEFVVLLQYLATDDATAIKQAGRVAEKIRLALSKPFQFSECQGDCRFHLSASIGVTLFVGHQLSAEDLFKYADTAMYQAKQAGRDTVRFHDPAMQQALEEAEELERELRRAIDEEHFALHYQPQMDAHGRLLGAEALLRWVHPERGLITPLAFIPLAEENGMILPIGSWVLHAACAQLAAWSGRPGQENFRLAVNVSPRQFHQPNFVGEVEEVIGSTGIDPRRLKLELTESLVLADLNDTIVKMEQLRALGVGFAMDDFGTGYSSLAKLKQLPLEQLKIDRAFIRDLENDPQDAAIVETIIAMGRTLGFEIVAEGVENEQQLHFLQQHGCHMFQGYYFSPPVSAAKFEKFG